MPRASIVIPNWNGLSHLEECFRALSHQTFQDFEVIFVDNNSSDSSIEWVRQNQPAVRIISRSDNGGFAKAVNAGILASAADYVVLLNNDTAACPDWLGQLVAALDGHPGYDFAASLMLLYHSDGLVNAAGDVYSLWTLAGRNRGLNKSASRFQRTGRVLGASAGASIYRRSLFDDIGLFDEDFFLMSEDTDFNVRALIAGKRCLYVPSALVRHKYRASIDREPPLAMRRLADRNEGIVAGKDMPTILFPALPFLYVWRTLRKTILVTPKVWPRVPSLLTYTPTRVRAEFAGFRIGLQKRDDVWRLRRASLLEIVRWLARGWQTL